MLKVFMAIISVAVIVLLILAMLFVLSGVILDEIPEFLDSLDRLKKEMRKRKEKRSGNND